MQTLVWEAARTMHMRDYPLPEVPANEVQIKVDYAGICGSELSGYLGHNALRTPPAVMGHEFSGTIADLGEEVTGLSVGQAVTVNPLDYCGICAYCERGLNQLCVDRQLIGAHRPGAFAEYVSVPAKLVTALPEGMSTRDGALTEPTGCAVRIGELAGDVNGVSCLIIGAGPIGLLSLQILLLNGAERVFIAELDPHRRAMGEALGGITIDPAKTETVDDVLRQTKNRGVAVAVDAVGTAKTRAQCVGALMSTGTLILSGLHEETSAIPAANIIRNEIVVKGAFAYSPANFATALERLHAGEVTLETWITEAPLSSGGDWFEKLVKTEGGVAKVLLVP